MWLGGKQGSISVRLKHTKMKYTIKQSNTMPYFKSLPHGITFDIFHFAPIKKHTKAENKYTSSI